MLSIFGMMSCCLDMQIIAYVLLFMLLGIPIYLKLRKKEDILDPQGRAVLITGCDSGFGNQLALRLLDMGFTVFATCLFPDGEGAQTLIKNSSPGQVKVVRLDVTSDKEMEQVKQYVQNNLPVKGLWGIVNNAGICQWGMVEWLSMDKYQRLVDINLLGSIRTTLCFAPLVKKSKGRMVFLSSISAHVGFLNGMYAMTKAGLEKFCDSLQVEMRQFDVLVSIIEPGNYAPSTNIQPQITADQIWDSLSAEAQKDYSKELVKHTTYLVNKQFTEGSNKIYEVVDAIVDALTSATPRRRYLVATFAEKISVYCSLWFPFILEKYFVKILKRIKQA